MSANGGLSVEAGLDILVDRMYFPIRCQQASVMENAYENG